MQKVCPAHHEGVEPEFARHTIEQAFECMARIDRAVAAHGSARRQIGVDAIAIVFDRRNIVDALQQCAGIKNGDDPIPGISAAALRDFALASGDPPVAAHAEL